MTLPVRLLPEARIEFDEATDWYESRWAGLGATFVARIRDLLLQIGADPERLATVYRDVRRVVVPRFPYIILCRRDSDEVLVISIFHTSRDPSVWRTRA